MQIFSYLFSYWLSDQINSSKTCTGPLLETLQVVVVCCAEIVELCVAHACTILLIIGKAVHNLVSSV